MTGPNAAPGGTAQPGGLFRAGPVELATVADTRAFGAALAAILRRGDLVVLAGPLGAGKTVLAQGIGAGLGVAGAVTSPTFVIARVHPPDPAHGGKVSMVHVDAYRLGAVPDPRAEVDDLDLDTVAEESVMLVEWGEGVVEHLTDAHLQVRIDRPGRPGSEEVRVVEVAGHGGDWACRLRTAAALRREAVGREAVRS